MLEMVHYIPRFIMTTKHVIYGAILSAARGFGEFCKLPSEVWCLAPAKVEFDAF